MRRAVIALLILLASIHNAAARPLRVVCVEAVWCDIASQIGAGTIITQDLITRQAIDPHFQQISASRFEQLEKADFIIVNGAGYDNWAEASINGLSRDPKSIINVGLLVPEMAQRNPHLYYSVDVVTQFAQEWTSRLAQCRPQNQDRLRTNLDNFLKDVISLRKRISALRQDWKGSRVAESEPVAALLLNDLGITTINPRFARAIMHHAEPSPRDVAGLQSALETHAVRAFFVNTTVVTPSVEILVKKARHYEIPIIYVTEYPPAKMNWQDWLNAQLTYLEKISP